MRQRDMIFQQFYKWMSQIATTIQPYGEALQRTSLLNAEEREMVGYCYAYIKMFGNDDLSKFLQNIVIPTLREIGYARRPRSELTDLGYFIGAKHQKEIEFAFPEVEETKPEEISE